MTNLKSVVIGQNKYCGPAVLSILTGRNTDDCAYAISRVNGKYQITGVELPDLLKAASNLGFDSQSVNIAGSLFMVITQLVVQDKDGSNDGMYIVTLPKHFVTIEVNNKKVYFCDNHTKEPISAAASARLGQAVVGLHKVTKRKEAEIVHPVRQKMKYKKVEILVNGQWREVTDIIYTNTLTVGEHTIRVTEVEYDH
jgi:hypothetical protein